MKELSPKQQSVQITWRLKGIIANLEKAAKMIGMATADKKDLAEAIKNLKSALRRHE